MGVQGLLVLTSRSPGLHCLYPISSQPWLPWRFLTWLEILKSASKSAENPSTENARTRNKSVFQEYAKVLQIIYIVGSLKHHTSQSIPIPAGKTQRFSVCSVRIIKKKNLSLRSVQREPLFLEVFLVRISGRVRSSPR